MAVSRALCLKEALRDSYPLRGVATLTSSTRGISREYVVSREYVWRGAYSSSTLD